jgi:hypothetical protein
MINEVRIGTMLIENGTRTPESLEVGTAPYSAGWSFITDSTSVQLGKDIEKLGWTFFFMAGQIYGAGFGFSDKARMDRAVGQLIHMVTQEKCNCLEITGIKRRSFLGISHTSVDAHARHIQQSRSFHPLAGDPVSTDHAPVPATRSRIAPREAIQTWENEGGLRAKVIQRA